MKNFFAAIILITGALMLSSCRVSVGAGYGHDGRWHHHHGRGRWVAVATPAEQTQYLAADYNVKEASAAKIVTLMNTKNPQSELKALNLQVSDVAPLTDLKMPSDSSVHKIAKSLNENDESVSRMMKDFIADVSAEQAAE